MRAKSIERLKRESTGNGSLHKLVIIGYQYVFKHKKLSFLVAGPEY